MAVAPGSRLGSYEIISAIGAGGMGEVYRARDTKLGREVAIKILPNLFVDDPERVARFEREAQVLAALNHPHIAAIYGLEEANGSRFLVLELVDGETLAQRLTRGALPLDETLSIAKEIIDALEAAHDKGIIHRDLKPANIALTADGQVKVLDFGLAKAMESDPGSNLTNSPTLTIRATQAGFIMGTAAYMSPEQAKGRAADKRADVWAFGCVLYEMLTGKRAFEGEDVSDTLAAILRGEPDWNAVVADVPANIGTILRRCLEKDRRMRIPDISVVRFLLTDAGALLPSPALRGSAASMERRRGLVWKAAAVLLALTSAAGFMAAYVARSTPPRVARFFVMPPEKVAFITGGIPAATAVISPDGTKLAFTARDSTSKVQLWMRPIDSLTAQPLAGTDGASFPFWSPDSRFLAFFAGGNLQKIAVGGGPAQTLCAGSGRGGTWHRDGVIVFNGGPGPLLRVSPAGGEPTPVTKVLGSFPSFLPDGQHVLFYQGDGIYVTSLNGGEPKRLVLADSGGVFAAAGYLLFVRAGTLLAQSFNAATLELTGDPFPVAERVEFTARPGLIGFSVSDNGVLAYGVGSGGTASLQMVWVDRDGKVVEVVGPPAEYRGVDLAPDGRRVAAHRHEGTGGDIWITDFSRGGVTSRLTFDVSQENATPVWSPDGRAVAYGSRREGKFGLFRRASDGSSGEETLVEPSSMVQLNLTSWSPDGRWIVYEKPDPKTRRDLWALSTAGERKSVLLVNSPFDEGHGVVSPDGKWLAYRSNESGRQEIYVRPFPSGAGKWPISTSGGTDPRWRPDGRELFFKGTAPGVLGGKLLAVDVRPGGSTFEAGAPKELFVHAQFGVAHEPFHSYAVAPDGQRFLLPRTQASLAEEQAVNPIAVVLNWTDALKR